MAWDVFDLYAGIGGLGMGFERAGFTSKGAIDVWNKAIEANARLFNHKATVANVMDADSIVLESGWDAENGILVGGPPCQGFSYANQSRGAEKRKATSTVNYKSAEDLRSEVGTFSAKIRALGPTAFVMENVGGVIKRTSHAVQEAGGILEDEMPGYHVECRYLNASEYGVPQHRNRAVFIGVKDSLIDANSDWNPWPERTHFDFAKKVRSVNARIGLKEKGSDAKKDAKAYKEEYLQGGELDQDLTELLPAVTVRDAIGDLPKLEAGESSKIPNHDAGQIQERVRRCLELIPPGGNIRDVYDQDPSRLNDSVREKLDDPNSLGRSVWYLYKRMNWAASPGPAIPCEIRAGNGYAHPTQHRAITVREAARLQTFDDDVVLTGTKSDQYRLIGNAVPPKLSEVMATSLLKSLNEL